MKYKELDKTASLLSSSHMTKSISKFIHNLQLERGLSAGYIVAKDKDIYRQKLLEQQKMTDIAYRDFLDYIKSYSKNTNNMDKLVFYKNRADILDVLKHLHQLKSIRNSILKSSISFKEEMSFYTYTNAKLMDIIQVLSSPSYSYNGNSMDIYKLVCLEENAGLERAYIYNALLSRKSSNSETKKILNFIATQENLQKQFLADASLEDLALYNDIITQKAQEDVDKLREEYFKGKLDFRDAKRWFLFSSKRIDEFDKLSIKIIDNYLKNVKEIHNNAKGALFLTLFLWILAIASFLLLMYILNRLIDSEAKLLENLRIASYAFDAHEAMTITDPNGTILRVNKAFTQITGYDAAEVVGKNPRVLKSFKHSDEFYKEMWRDLHTKGRWSSDIYNKRKNGEIYAERLSITAVKDEKDITTHYIAQFLDISELKKAKEDAEYQARHDTLTELPNRISMIEKLREELVRAKRHNFLDAFLFIDLDAFKSVNDNYGHIAGDKLLVNVAKRFQNSVREEDYIARISGDEFCIILLDLGDSEDRASVFVKDICTKILKNLEKPFFINEHKINISASIGVKIFPQGMENVNDVINSADAVMYKAKNKGKGRTVFFNKTIEHKIREMVLFKDEIKEAFKKRQFRFYFQPKVNLNTNRVCGAELLVRWQHPTRGLLYPEHFLQDIKDLGMITDVTKLALENACKFIKENKDVLEGTLSINISSFELSSNIFVQSVKEIILSHEVEPSFIELEVLEDELLDDFDSVVLNIHKLRNFGIKFSIDDFGAKYSYTKYLKKLPVDTLKIDKYFMENLDDDSNKELAKMMINIAKIFKLSIVIEGVENRDQLDFFQQNSAEQFQGFYFSKAINEQEFKEFISKF